jgi:hypothetical protein
MPARPRGGSLRSLIACLTVAIIGVTALDATAIVAAPAKPASTSGTTLGPGHDIAAANQGGVGPLLRIIHWSGYTWLVFPGNQAGPEHTQLASAEDAVHVDSRGRLHLAIRKINGQWRGAEIESLNPISYGTYNWVVDTRTAEFANSTVLGMFVYRPGSQRLTNEIDIEDARFGHLRAPNNGQFVVQPYYAPHHYHAFYVRKSYNHIWQQFQWLPGKPGDGIVHFQSRVGTGRHGRLFSRWTYHGYSTPTPMNMHLYIDIWLNERHPPLNGTHSAIIRSFHFTPAG